MNQMHPERVPIKKGQIWSKPNSQGVVYLRVVKKLDGMKYQAVNVRNGVTHKMQSKTLWDHFTLED